jgi:threonine synthase
LCIECGATFSLSENIYRCPRCGDLLEIKVAVDELKGRVDFEGLRRLPLSVWRYAPLLPIADRSKIVTLNEGGTGLHRCRRLGSLLGLEHLYVKNEGENPTGSFKDRGMTVGVTRALEVGAKRVICASTGNTAASLAAYSAKAGLETIVLIPSGKIAYGKLAQAIVYGARIVQIRGNFDEALKIVFEICSRNREIYLLNSINPFRIEGQKTLAYEVCDQLSRQPDYFIIPVGNAGNISAAWKGFTEYYELGQIEARPKMVGVQAEGAAPIAEAVAKRRFTIEPVKKPETIATAIRIGMPVSWKKALRAIYESEGTAITVSDEEILEAQSLLARLEGLFVEPASATSIAALKKLKEGGYLSRDDIVVCVATGHGLKDPDVVTRLYEKPVELEADVSSIERFLGLAEKEVASALLNPLVKLTGKAWVSENHCFSIFNF